MQFAEIPALYWKIVAYGGAAAYVYRVVVAPLLRRARPYVVEAVHPLNPSTVEVTLRPEGGKPRQRAGQFTFVSFPGAGALAEPHPFTVSSGPHEPNLRLSIKAAGDWTRQLARELKPGAKAQVDGCYGMFDYTRGGAEQIWIAGGIGVTPFLSWVRSLENDLTHTVYFFYTVRSEADALFWKEFAAAAERHPRLTAVLNVSSRDGSLTVEKIAAQVRGGLPDKHIYMCGPAAMSVALAAQFRDQGVPAEQIHYEEFNFR
jgi:predicted ferric reductase